MAVNILITGAAGYIGGSILADFVAQEVGPVHATKLFAAVRSEAQIQSVSRTGAQVLRVDLDDSDSVSKTIIQNDIDIVVHAGLGYDQAQASHLIKALGQRRKFIDKEVYYIHPGVMTVFSAEAGWPFGEIRDDDEGLIKKEREMGIPHNVRETDLLVVDEAKAQGVTSFNVVIPIVYGRGSGEVRQLSVNIPGYVRTSVTNKTVRKFESEGHPPAVHISDLMTFYRLLVEKILRKEPIRQGEQGTYFVFAHRLPWWAVMERIAQALHRRGLVLDSNVEFWSSYEAAAEALSLPKQHVRAMTTATGEQVAIKAYAMGWKPMWNEQMCLENIEDEVAASLELDSVKTSIFDKLLEMEQK